MDSYTFEIVSPKYGAFTVTAPERFREKIEQHTWCVARELSRVEGRNFIVVTHVNTGRRPWKRLSLHRLVWDLAGHSRPQTLDHVDGQPLNNAEDNLRAATWADNAQKRKRNTSGVTGVTWRRDVNRWWASIRVNGKTLHLGFFHSKTEAQITRDMATLKYHGTFAVLNSPPANDNSEMPAISPEEYRALLECAV